MSPIALSFVALVCVFGGALAGIFLRSALPRHHLNSESKHMVGLGMGLVGTMAALVLGLLVASAKDSYDAQNNELTQLSANIVLLDRILSHYGPEAQESRELLRSAAARIAARMWHSGPAGSEPTASGAESIYDKVLHLSPKDDPHRALQSQALSIANNLSQERWLMYEQGSTSVPLPMLVVLVLWLTIIFISFGLFAPTNGTVIASLFVSAMSVSCAVLLILEMYRPFEGLIQISSAPLRAALAHLGK